MDSDNSETNLVIVTKKYRCILFCKLYWRSLVFLITPIVLLPIAFIGHNHAYPCFYVFLVSAVYWTSDALHPGVISLLPLACYSVIGTAETGSITQVYVRNGLLDCLAIMMVMVAVEHSEVHKRVALKLLRTVGCSHYRLSLVLFFSSMFLSMWMSNTAACGLMMPLVKAMLQSLEKMGIIEMYQTVGKAEQKSHRHEMNHPRPTDFTIFYFLGIAYSCAIGGMATLHGSQTNQIFRAYCESIFPKSPKIEFPQFMLLNLPGVLAMEALLYVWMNAYFLKMFRNNEVAMHSGLTEEEARYIKTLLDNQYVQLGKIKFHDIIIGVTVLLVIALQIASSSTRFDNIVPGTENIYTHVKVSAPSIIGVVILFAVPSNLDFLKFFKRRNDINAMNVLPTAPSKACLNWNLVRSHLLWSVLFTIGGSCMTFEALTQSGMTSELGRFLLLFRSWPPSVLALVLIVFCKTLTEFASNSCVVYALLPEVARLSVESKVHPHYLMLAATLASSMPCHLVTGTPTLAMVSQYVHIPTWKMLSTGVGPSVIAILVPWFTTTVWSKAIWIDANTNPPWALHYTMEI